MKRAIALLACCFAIGFGAVLASRLDSGAIAVVAGVVAGVLASIPTALLLVWALGKRTSGEVAAPPRIQQQNSPPVIIIGGGQPLPWSLQNQSPMLPTPGQRQFHTIGEEWREDE